MRTSGSNAASANQNGSEKGTRLAPGGNLAGVERRGDPTAPTENELAPAERDADDPLPREHRVRHCNALAVALDLDDPLLRRQPVVLDRGRRRSTRTRPRLEARAAEGQQTLEIKTVESCANQALKA
jgi:hypothetical protein